MSTAAAPQTEAPALTLPQIQAAMARGIAKAADEHLVAYRDGAGFLVPSADKPGVEYSVVRCGHQWFSWSCDCQAGAHGRICKHVALAVWASKYGVHAKRPAPAIVGGSSALSEIEERRQQRNAYTAEWIAAEQARLDALFGEDRLFGN